MKYIPLVGTSGSRIIINNDNALSFYQYAERLWVNLNITLITFVFMLMFYLRILQGDLSNSIMFYGLYADMPKHSYKMPIAFFLAWLCANLFSFIFIVTL